MGQLGKGTGPATIMLFDVVAVDLNRASVAGDQHYEFSHGFGNYDEMLVKELIYFGIIDNFWSCQLLHHNNNQAMQLRI